MFDAFVEKEEGLNVDYVICLFQILLKDGKMFICFYLVPIANSI